MESLREESNWNYHGLLIIGFPNGAFATRENVLNPALTSAGRLFDVEYRNLPLNDPRFPGALLVGYYGEDDGRFEYQFVVSPETGTVYLLWSHPDYPGDGNAAQMVMGTAPGQVEE